MKAAIQFSGGKDSLALLFHLEALLPWIDVLMLDTGDMAEAAYANAEFAKTIAPRFHVIKTDSKESRKKTGDPDSKTWTACCASNIWWPMHEFIRRNCYRQVFRGTKRSDPYLHAISPGDVADGVIYTMPLWEWSDDDVKEYLGDKLPEAYKNGAKGMPDCVSCPVPESCGGRTRGMWK